VIVSSDGSERSGMLDDDGKADFYLDKDDAPEIVFVDVDKARKN
jgi:hypothetical protein